MNKMNTVLDVSNLRKTYMMGQVPVEALAGVSFKVDHGELVAVQGPSGSGKSTLLNMIGALDRPSEGSVTIEGVDASTLDDNGLAEIRQRVGFVFQFFNLIPRLSARDNVELPLVIGGVDRQERRARSEDVLQKVGLGDRMDHKPSELSGGERQRVAVARAIIVEPSFLLLDEPTGNLDTKTASEIMDLIEGLNKEIGVTGIIVTHDSTVASIARRQIRLVDGLIVSDEVV
jgi:putative ABC transport system ATP-binding protein